MPVTYTLDDSITTLLATQSDVSREDCDFLARSLLSSESSPVPIQGAFSYTVADEKRLVQFRASNSPLKIDILQQARSIYVRIIAETTYHSQIGHDRPLLVYVIEKLPGITYLEYLLEAGLDSKLDEVQYHRQRTLIKDFANFFAASWMKPQAVDTAAVRQRLENDLHLLAQSLPACFVGDIASLIDNLDLVMQGLLLVLTHDDLVEMNILVDKKSGHLTGIIDWAEADVLPFGFNFCSLENLLGVMDSDGWHYFDQHSDLRALFWNTLHNAVAETGFPAPTQATVESSTRLGLLLRYAFRWDDDDDDDGQRKVVAEGGSEMKYLDALFLQKT